MATPNVLPDTPMVPIPTGEAATRQNYISAASANKVVSPMAVLGTTGLRRASGFIDEEYLGRLRGVQGTRFYRQMMDNNAVIGAMMFVVKALMRQVAWKMVPASDKGEGPRWAEFVDECFTDMSHTFKDFFSEAMSFLGYGWSYFELAYKLRKGDTDDPTTRSAYTDGMVGLRKIETRSQDTLWQWVFDPADNGLAGMIQLDPWNAFARGPVFLPISKCLLFRTETTKQNPEGRSLLRSVVREYHMLTRIQEIEAIGIERDLAGMPIFEAPMDILLEGATSDQKALRKYLENMVQQIKVDERYGGVIPSELNEDGKPTGFKFRLVTTGGKRAIDTNEIVKRYETRMAMTFLAEFMFVGTENVGTQTLFQGKSNLFGIAMGTFLDSFADTVNRYLIPRLMKYNGVPRELWPELTHGDVSSPDLKAIGEYIRNLGMAGIISPNRELEGKLLGFANLPPPDEEDLAIFDDPTKPTPASPEDQATGLLSERQSQLILRVNGAVLGGKMSFETAAELLGSALGMDPKEAERFITPQGEQPAVLPMGQQNPPVTAGNAPPPSPAPAPIVQNDAPK